MKVSGLGRDLEQLGAGEERRVRCLWGGGESEDVISSGGSGVCKHPGAAPLESVIELRCTRYEAARIG